jgi:hypothetical protein
MMQGQQVPAGYGTIDYRGTRNFPGHPSALSPKASLIELELPLAAAITMACSGRRLEYGDFDHWIEVVCAMILGSTSAFCAARVPYPLPDDPQLVHQ